MNAPPRVSVIVPCYRQGHYLAGCVDSALSQGPGVEVIVVNDGSPDDADAVARGYGDRIVYVAQANAGLAAARNRGIALARGEWLLFLDSDDALEPGAIAAHLAVADARPDARLLCGGHRHVDEQGRGVGDVRPAPPFEPDAFHALLAGNAAPPCAYLFRADAVSAAGGLGLDPALYGHEDWSLLLTIAADGGAIARVPACVARYRVSATSMSGASGGGLRMHASGVEVLRRFAGRHGDCARCPAIVREALGRRIKLWTLALLRAGHRGAALRLWATNLAALARGGECRILLATPVLAAFPTATFRRRWG